MCWLYIPAVSVFVFASAFLSTLSLPSAIRCDCKSPVYPPIHPSIHPPTMHIWSSTQRGSITSSAQLRHPPPCVCIPAVLSPCFPFREGTSSHMTRTPALICNSVKERRGGQARGIVELASNGRERENSAWNMAREHFECGIGQL